jgi:hypothetical protein
MSVTMSVSTVPDKSRIQSFLPILEVGSIAVLGHAGQVLGGTADDIFRPAACGEVAGAPVRGDAGRGG